MSYVAKLRHLPIVFAHRARASAPPRRPAGAGTGPRASRSPPVPGEEG